jgi:quinol monooxygenase YgiN
MHELAAYVRRELPDSSWTTYRDPQSPTQYVSMIRFNNAAAEERHRNAPGTRAFDAALAPLVDGKVEYIDCELVTSSDLAPRHRERQPGRRRPR